MPCLSAGLKSRNSAGICSSSSGPTARRRELVRLVPAPIFQRKAKRRVRLVEADHQKKWLVARLAQIRRRLLGEIRALHPRVGLANRQRIGIQPRPRRILERPPRRLHAARSELAAFGCFASQA